jgi:putative peptide zinc metalloprotease protein
VALRHKEPVLLMSNEVIEPNQFVLLPLKLERMETALTEARYMVTLVGQGKRFMVAPKLADVIRQLQQQSVEEAAQTLSGLWQQEVTPSVLRGIIERQIVPRGMAYEAGQTPPLTMSAAQRKAERSGSLLERLLSSQFRWRLLPPRRVKRICAPLAVCYERFSVLLALLLIAATRWMLYTTVDRHFARQVMLEFTPREYLFSLCLLITVVLIHEFGHAAAQLRYGLPAGGIGFQFYHYIPAFFANVDASWGLKPARRMVVDIGGIYFQSLAASLIFLLYLQTHFVPLLTTVIASDFLCFVAINPFLRFDGYWLLADALAVPNLKDLSKKLLARCWYSLRARSDGPKTPALGRTRTTLLVIYALLRQCFWVFLVALLFLRARRILGGTWAMFAKLFAFELEGLRTRDLALIAASLIRLVLFTLLVLAPCTVIGSLLLRWAKLGQDRLSRRWSHKGASAFSGAAPK